MKVLKEFKQNISCSLDSTEIPEALKALSQHFFNDDFCNHYVNGVLVAKYPEIEASNPKIKEAYCNVRRGYCVTITVQLMEDGTVRMKPIKH